jgi:hypothetical protein
MKYAQIFQYSIAFINKCNEEAVERGEVVPYNSPWPETAFCSGK